MFEFFHNPNFDFLGKKVIFLGLSLILIVVGVGSLWSRGGPRLGIDFKGGTHVYVKFSSTPDTNAIRDKLQELGLGSSTIQSYGAADGNEIIIAAEQIGEGESGDDLDATRQAIVAALQETFAVSNDGRDLNNLGTDALRDTLAQLDPLALAATPSEAAARYSAIAEAITAYRDNQRGGLLTSFEELRSVDGVPPAVVNRLEQDTMLAPFVVRSVEVVGPKVGQQLRDQALWATGLALGGMLVYIGFRFRQWVYGSAAVIAVFHDVLITLGLISVFDYEFTLNTVAALLTLVGYSVNDTIVTFDRIRENARLLRKETFAGLVNRSINQTLSRTVLTSGLTLLTVLALFFLGGEVLHGFAFTLVVGVLVGTYSSIFIASPIVVGWMERGKGS
jgi:preprotein translocase subunit SecF